MLVAPAAIALGFSGPAAHLAEKYQCPACEARAAVLSLGFSVAEENCDAACAVQREASLASAAPASPVQLRVSKGFGTKPYDTLRLSAITAASAPAPFASDYSAPFKYKWTQFSLHSSVISVLPGVNSSFDLGNTTVTQLWLPKQGAGAAGVMVADPCVTASKVGCTYARKFKTDERTMTLLDTFASHDDVDYWGILGDNFYDQSGEVTAAQYDKLSLPTLSKIFMTVPGNHDYWVLGTPALGTTADQYGNGFMQYYAQDTRASAAALPGNSSAPFDFSVDPNKGHVVVGGNKPAIDNHFFYNQIGNTGFIGYSGAYTLKELTTLMTEACAWLPTQPGLKLAVLLGHWDTSGLGATSDTAAPGLYDHVKGLPGCDAFDTKGMLKFIMGHTHCNIAHPHGHQDTGFMVAGMGMEGCGNYGIPILDTTDDKVRMWYFPVVAKDGKDTYDSVLSCVSKSGWRQCTHLAESWLEQPLA